MRLNPQDLAVTSFHTSAHAVAGREAESFTIATFPTAEPTVGARRCPPQTNQTC